MYKTAVQKQPVYSAGKKEQHSAFTTKDYNLHHMPITFPQHSPLHVHYNKNKP